MILVEGLDEDMFEDIADVTLIDEDTKPILTDDANIKYRGVIGDIINYFTLMSSKLTLFALFFIFRHYSLFFSKLPK